MNMSNEHSKPQCQCIRSVLPMKCQVDYNLMSVANESEEYFIEELRLGFEFKWLLISASWCVNM